MNRHCVEWNGIPEEVAPSGVGKRVLRGAGASLVMVRVPAGTKADRHSHPHEQLSRCSPGPGCWRRRRGPALLDQAACSTLRRTHGTPLGSIATLS